MLKDLAFPAKRDLLPKMLSTITDELVKYTDDYKLLNRLKLCAEEILVNIIDYSKSANLYISCEVINNSIRFEFVDEGTPYDPLQNAPDVDVDAEIDSRGIGGLGIFLYTTIMDKMEYKFADGKNHLIAIKNLNSEAVN